MSFKGPKQTLARAARTADSIHGDTSEEVVETEKATSKNDEKAPLAKAGNKRNKKINVRVYKKIHILVLEKV